MPIDCSFSVNGRSVVRDAFVETGTYRGDTVAAALAAGFKTVASVETDVERYVRALERFKGEPRVRLVLGSSPDVLESMLDPGVPTTVYLDAHYCGDGGKVDDRYGECPLLAELDVITGLTWTVLPVVVVDDAHMFRRPWSDDLCIRFVRRQWPTTGEIEERLRGYTFVERDLVLYCLPPDFRARAQDPPPGEPTAVGAGSDAPSTGDGSR